MKNPIRSIAEYLAPSAYALGSALRYGDISRSGWYGAYSLNTTTFTPELARSLYRNDDAKSNLGGGFANPIINVAVEFTGLPSVATDDEDADNFLNECIHDYWAAQIQEIFTMAFRDGKAVARFQTPSLSNPLATDDDRTHGRLIVYPAERVQVIYSPQDASLIERAIIAHDIMFEDEQEGIEDPLGHVVNMRSHEVWEVITPESYRYFDKTDNQELTEWRTSNPEGFVPVLEIFNEWDSVTNNGQSDLEAAYPFMLAFHEVLLQGLAAHKYHSTPKAHFKLDDVGVFLKNNFRDVLNDDGSIKSGSKIAWRGREIIFTGSNEDIKLIEAKSVLGDTKTLLEFLIDCISIAAETPEWAFMRVESGTSQGGVNAQSIPLEKKITRKRTMVQPYIQTLCKMALAANGSSPVTPSLIWDEIRPENLLTTSQAAQQLATALELPLQRGIMSDQTAQKIWQRLFRQMKSPKQESKEAKKNVDLLAASMNGNGNGAVPVTTEPVD